MIFPNSLSQNEKKYGLWYLAFSLIVLPNALYLLPLEDSRLNFLYYCANFLAAVLIFRRFLLAELRTAMDRVFPVLYFAALAYLGHQLLGQIYTNVLLLYFPEFYNVNDAGILSMLRQDFALMLLGTVVLVPLAEECFFRGLIFRGLYDRSPVLAYAISMAAFAAIHVAGYVGTASPVQLLLCFIQYLPAGYCLCFAYRRSGSIASPVLVHCVINALSILNATRLEYA